MAFHFLYSEELVQIWKRELLEGGEYLCGEYCDSPEILSSMRCSIEILTVLYEAILELEDIEEDFEIFDMGNLEVREEIIDELKRRSKNNG